jgi:hypothetical protein
VHLNARHQTQKQQRQHHDARKTAVPTLFDFRNACEPDETAPLNKMLAREAPGRPPSESKRAIATLFTHAFVVSGARVKRQGDATTKEVVQGAMHCAASLHEENMRLMGIDRTNVIEFPSVV